MDGLPAPQIAAGRSPRGTSTATVPDMDPILNRDAHLIGLTRANLRSHAYAQPVNGASLPAAQRDDLAAVCRAVALVLPDDAVFTHLTAARLRGWWLPDVAAPLIACSDSDAAHQDRRGVYVRRCAIPPWHREARDDVPIASAAWTIVELAEHLSLVDLVIAIDSALFRGHVTTQQIWATLVPGRRGVRTLRRALSLSCDASESPWETILRLVHVLSGVEVDPQLVIENRAGVAIARADLRIRGTRRLAEYDGADHRDRDQHQRDLRRDKHLAREGWARFGYVATEIINDAPRIVRDADAALNRPHDPTRVHGWMSEARLSSLYLAGREALTRRLRRFVRDASPHRARRPSTGAN